jgi:3'(2'), 5'-bisphosphate nucleotidase
MNETDLLHLAIGAAVKAGEEILKIYNTDFKVEIKSDSTPVTTADKVASKSIISDLATTNIPVLSEEDEHFSYENRKQWSRIWIVDPLDGTKEFVKRNGEFTVNIALVQDHKPIIGVIYSPVFKYLYYASKGNGSFKINEHDVIAEMNSGDFSVKKLIVKAKQLPLQEYPDVYTIVASRSHLSKQVSDRVAKAKLNHNNANIINTGSSIKFCWIAEGLAHEYPRYGTTMEWDTAAGQCIVEEAGGKVLDLHTNEPMVYNRKNLQNNDFIVLFKSTVKI